MAPSENHSLGDKPPTDIPHPLRLLQQVMLSLEQESGLHMSFEDLMGMTTGPHRDVPSMVLDFEHEVHSCSFCTFAKSNPRGEADCIRNKVAVNRLVFRKRAGLVGHCHLGLLDMAEPLIYHNSLIGIFYYGSVRLRGKEQLIEDALVRYCRRRNFEVEAYRQQVEALPIIEEADIPRHREALRVVVRLAHYFFESAGVRPELYRSRRLAIPYEDPKQLPWVVKEAIHYISANLDKSFIVKDLAAHLNCHPDFLGRKFKQHTGIEMNNYLLQARVERAKHLLENPKIDVGDAAIQSGFSDRVHFSKVFRRLTGETPGKYQKDCLSRADK